MARWIPAQTRVEGGRFAIVARPPNRTPVDITIVRGVPVQLEDYSTADPFGWAGGRIDLPMLTAMDDFGAGDLSFMTEDTLIDIFYVPADDNDLDEVINPLTQRRTLDYFSDQAEIVWEGQVASFNQREDAEGDGWGLDMVGAMYQLDGYKAKPNFPFRPIPHEKLIAAGFSKTKSRLTGEARPHLKTGRFDIEWPAGWTKIFTTDQKNNPTVYTPQGLAVGEKYSGFSTRNTGGWDNWLTSFVADLLAVMWIDDKSGVTPGNQWTLLMDPGRKPVLRPRDRQRTPDFEFWYGTPGMKVTGLSKDLSQTSDVMYGEGEAQDGTIWRNADISIDGDRTAYIPMVIDPSIYPFDANNPNLDTGRIIRERMVKFAPGISQEQAFNVSGQMAAFDREPGWTATLELEVDPSTMRRWKVRAGMVVKIKGLAGSGAQGINFHIAETSASPTSGKVTCKIDSKFRDLLAFEEAVARTRDPLIPSKLLQVGKASITIEDRMAPWDYKAGSGFMPQKAKNLFKDIPSSVQFPWEGWTSTHQPVSHTDQYILVKANAKKRKDRWAFFPILMSEKGTIRLLQIAAYDKYGVQVLVPFHLSLYKNPVDYGSMPQDDNGDHWPFFPTAFQTVTEDGYPLPANALWGPDQSMIIGWGDGDQKAGYSPGSESDGDPVTGRLVDASTWTYDCTSNPEFDPNSKKKQPRSAYTIYGALYAEYTEPLYFMGRLYRQSQGGGV
jgi:hypothetical protein